MTSFVDAPVAFYQRRLYTEFAVAGWSNWAVPLGWRIGGEVDRGTVLAAVDAAFQRHEALRTTIVEADGELCQRIWAFEPPSIAEVSIRSASSMDDDAAYAAVADAVSAPFEVTGRLSRVSLFRAGEDDQLLLFVMHHAIVDGWSCMVLDAELRVALAARPGEAPAPLAPAAQMRDYVELERAGDATRQAAYLRPRIAPTTLRRRLRRQERPVDASADCLAVVNSSPVDMSVVRRLDELTAQVRSTRAMTMLAALAGAYSPWAVDALRIGVLHANRFPPQLEGAVGQIAMALPLRVPVTDELTFRELLAFVRREWLDVLARRVQATAFEQLAGTTGLGTATTFDTMVNVLPSVSYPPAAEPDSAGVRIRQYDVPWTLRRMRHHGVEMSPLPDLVAYAVEDGRLGVLAHTDGGSMPAAALEVLCAHIVGSIDRLTRAPDRPLRETLAERVAVPGLDVELASAPA